MNITHFLFALSLLVLSACSSTKPGIAQPVNASATALSGTYWKLYELNGKTVGEAEEGKRREVFLSLNTKENRVSGNAGCNGFGGTYVLGAEGFRLQFSGMIRTQMACDGLELENEFLSVLEKTDSYYISRDTLQLNRARMAPLARFVAVPSRASASN